MKLLHHFYSTIGVSPFGRPLDYARSKYEALGLPDTMPKKERKESPGG